jgi:hypothetical protein
MAEFKKEIERLTERIAAERRRIQSQATKLERGEMGSAQNILAAQQRAPAAVRGGPRVSATSK